MVKGTRSPPLSIHSRIDPRQRSKLKPYRAIRLVCYKHFIFVTDPFLGKGVFQWQKKRPAGKQDRSCTIVAKPPSFSRSNSGKKRDDNCPKAFPESEGKYPALGLTVLGLQARKSLSTRLTVFQFTFFGSFNMLLEPIGRSGATLFILTYYGRGCFLKRVNTRASKLAFRELDWLKQDDSAAHSYLEVEPSPRLCQDLRSGES
ncbi:dihydroxy-acid dehydratase [Striga asiatica]|uniref:Dihydroxy-acid dehydratase n=1 Tax=Striga asiatica TaxID=4170 RepID=A0A5A7Q402_STRAF|nr:dihydroxy-acid dehydratase [Striga asiatica]